MAQCPNCARSVHFWHNHNGYCSKQCRTESISTCPVCGKEGLYKHARLGCCSEECRFWRVATLLGYDRDSLFTPAWDKIVYHVRLPSSSPEISSLQLDELEYDRAIDTVLVVAAPPWMTRSKVLAELPYERFDNTAWQHLWADGTLTEDELFRFHRICYEDDLLCQKLGEHVYSKLRQPVGQTQPAGTYALQPLPAATVETVPMVAPVQTRPLALLTSGQTGPLLVQDAPAEFVAQVQHIFEGRGYQVSIGLDNHSFILQRQSRTALASYFYLSGMVDAVAIQSVVAQAATLAASQSYVVTNGRFTLQAEDYASQHPVQLIDGEELQTLSTDQRPMTDSGLHTIAPAAEGTQPISAVSANGSTVHLNGNGVDYSADRTMVLNRPESSTGAIATISSTSQLPPVDAEIVPLPEEAEQAE